VYCFVNTTFDSDYQNKTNTRLLKPVQLPHMALRQNTFGWYCPHHSVNLPCSASFKETRRQILCKIRDVHPDRNTTGAEETIILNMCMEVLHNDDDLPNACNERSSQMMWEQLEKVKERSDSCQKRIDIQNVMLRNYINERRREESKEASITTPPIAATPVVNTTPIAPTPVPIVALPVPSAVPVTTTPIAPTPVPVVAVPVPIVALPVPSAVPVTTTDQPVTEKKTRILGKRSPTTEGKTQNRGKKYQTI
jgi:hypothetical protein